MNTKANYKSIEKEAAAIMNQREKDCRKTQGELQEERANLEKAKTEKARILESGSKEEFLKACEEVSRAENAVLYMEKRAEQLKEAHGIKVHDLKRIKKAIKAEQDSFTRAALAEIKTAVAEIWTFVEDTIKEQEKGSEVYSVLLSLYKDDTGAKEQELNSEGIAAAPYSTFYGFNGVIQLKQNLEKVKAFFERPEVKEFIEGR